MPPSVGTTGFRLITYAVVGGLLFTAGFVVRGDTPVPSVGGVRFADQSGPRDDPEAVRLLNRANAAEGQIPYLGTRLVAVHSPAGEFRELVELENVPGTGLVVEQRDDRTTHARLVASDDPGRSAGTVPDALGGAHTLTIAGSGRTAGRRARLVDAVRPDGSAAARFWLDTRTGLLLRRELYDGAGELTRSSGFVDVAIGASRFSARVPHQMPSNRGAVVPESQYADLVADGFSCCRPTLPGVRRLTAVRRTDNDRTVQLSYTDGLTVVSVFQRRGRLDGSALSGFGTERVGDGQVRVRYGMTSTAVWSSGGIVYTVVADTPYDLDAVVAALPHGSRDAKSEDGIGQRLDRGMSRMVSWFTEPFE